MKKKKSFLLSVIKIPYYVVRGIYRIFKKIEKKAGEKEIEKKREGMTAKYEDFKVLKRLEGDYGEWSNVVLNSESKIGIILGARGSGKTAFGIKLLENIYAKMKRNCFAMGFKSEEMPSWIKVVDDTNLIKNNSVVLIDEGGVLFNSRNSMSKPNKLLGELILIARHKNLTILFISQNSSNLDVNIIRQADFLALKPTSLLQKDFERKKIQEIYKGVENQFKKYAREKGITYIYSNEFRGFVSNALPSFWNVRISKSFS
ncbi:MAG: zonular occludens toxin domain-containing protein [Candidatus Pacearchaeota archaeon]|nr:zonular occludens toxin domain-containing protein [Candidatus Pacearchaeota archaeon]